MFVTLWVVLTKHGLDRTTKREPELKSNERAVKLQISYPIEAFDKPPHPTVAVELEAEHLRAAKPIIPTIHVEPAPEELADGEELEREKLEHHSVRYS